VKKGKRIPPGDHEKLQLKTPDRQELDEPREFDAPLVRVEEYGSIAVLAKLTVDDVLQVYPDANQQGRPVVAQWGINQLGEFPSEYADRVRERFDSGSRFTANIVEKNLDIRPPKVLVRVREVKRG